MTDAFRAISNEEVEILIKANSYEELISGFRVFKDFYSRSICGDEIIEYVTERIFYLLYKEIEKKDDMFRELCESEFC